jgi:hypothetical protein
LHQASPAWIVRDDGSFVVRLFRVAVLYELGENIREEDADGNTEKSTGAAGGIVGYDEVDKETSADAEAHWKGEKRKFHENII